MAPLGLILMISAQICISLNNSNLPSAFKNARTGCLRCNRTTAENNGRVDKLLRFLDKEKATVYKKVNGKWDKIK